MTRVEGKLFAPMALTLAFAVIGSMVAALTFIPVLISFAYKKAISDPDKPFKKRENRVFSIMEDAYGKEDGGLWRFSKLTMMLGCTNVLFLISFSSRLGTEFLAE